MVIRGRSLGRKEQGNGEEGESEERWKEGAFNDGGRQGESEVATCG